MSKLILESKKKNAEMSSVSQSMFSKPTIPAKILSRFGFWKNDMMFWSFYEPRNFGDWIGPYLFFKSTGRRPFYQAPKNGFYSILSAGSILHWITEADRAIVWGSGIMFRDTFFERPKTTLAVRGPLTRERFLQLSYDCPETYGDPGILLPRFFRPKNVEKEYSLGVIPHYAEVDLADKVVKYDSAIKVIDVTKPIEEVISAICSCEMVITSSLHGLIVSHAYGVPAGWVRFSSLEKPRIKGDGVKFLDYMLAFEGARAPECLGLESPADFRTLEIEKHITKTGLPDHRSAADNLWKCCPFPR